MRKSYILRKLILLFMTIVMPLIIFSSISLWRNDRNVIEDSLQMQLLKTDQYVEKLDYRFEQIYTIVSNIPYQSELGKLTLLSDILEGYEKAQLVNQLQEYLNNVRNSNNLIEVASVYVRSMGQVYSSHNNAKGICADISEETYQFLAELDIAFPSQIVVYEGNLGMIFKSSFKEPENIVEVIFSENHLREEFDREMQFPESYYFFDFHNGDYVLHNIGNEQLYQLICSASWKDGMADFRLGEERYYAFKSDFENLAASYICVIPSNILLEPVYPLYMYTVLFVLIMMFGVGLFFVLGVNLIHKPLVNLIDAFGQIEEGNLSVRIKMTSENEFSYLYRSFNDMAKNLQDLIDEVYNQKILRQRAEFKQLQSQVNPHFLYNSFFMLQRMIQQNMHEESIRVCKDLGICFRYITRVQEDFVALKDEYQYARIYSNIQTLRFGERIYTEFGDLPEVYACRKVPRLILQPVIENAYKYGLDNKVSDGLLRIVFQETEEGLVILVEDNGEELSDEKLQNIERKLNSDFRIDNDEVTGLINIQKRIHYFFKNCSTVKASRSPLGGLRITMFLIWEGESGNETFADS